MSARDGLVRMLADGERHSGSALASALGISRSAVWKQAHLLGEVGLELHQDRRRGYRLARPLELLDRYRILAALAGSASATCEQLDVVTVTDSTNTLLSGAPAPAAGLWRAALAEFQTGGRGRRARRWISPFGSGLCLSVSWSFASAPRELPALSLAAGVAVVRALAAAGATDLALKWPNDVLSSGAKLGGILVDVDGDSRGPLRAVVGVGLNITVPATLTATVAADGGLPPTGVEATVREGTVPRNALAAGILSALTDVLRAFAAEGFAPFAGEWQRLDFLSGRRIRLHHADGETEGIARGIDAAGALLLESPSGVSPVFSGEVTLRPDA